MLGIKKLLKDFIEGKPLDRSKEHMDLAEEIASYGLSKETPEEWAIRLAKDLAKFDD